MISFFSQLFSEAGFWQARRFSGRLFQRILALVMAVGLTLGLAVPPALADGVTQEQLDTITAQWEGSLHALNDVNCASCHQDSETKSFVAVPNQESCRTCHEQSVDTFLLGKHGIRTLEGESALTPALARLPMHEAAFEKSMSCNTCHDVHTVNTLQASTDSCMTCHNDTHTNNYFNSKHAELFEADRDLPRPSNASVSCATCHLPRHTIEIGGNEVVKVNHNNTYNLKPRDRMVADVCMNCHGVEYSYNSIFDDELVTANFDKPPHLELETFDLIRALEKRRSDNGDGE
ncbi:MAG: hypothetical protein ACFB9N_02610 [Geitlerinemataceae cyanobacterium]